MNQRLKLQLAGYVDDGMDYSNSAEVRNIVDASDVAREFYERLLFANKRLEGFFQSKEIHKTNKKLHKFIDDTLEPKDTFWTRWVPASGLMMAAVAMLITFGPFMAPVTEHLPYLISKLISQHLFHSHKPLRTMKSILSGHWLHP